MRTGWTAVAMPDHVPANMTNPPSTESLATGNAFDGMNNTRWGTGVFQDTLTFPLYFTVNMQNVMTISRITLYAGSQDTGDYPVQMDILVSTDGVSFTPAVTAHRPQPPTNGAMNGIRHDQHQSAGDRAVDPAQGHDGPAHDQPAPAGDRRDERLSLRAKDLSAMSCAQTFCLQS